MASTTANVPTQSASRYLQQLCKHWSHKFAVDFTTEQGRIELPGATATLKALPDALAVTLEGDEAATVETMKGVLADHLDRFAFREAPLPFDWR